MPLDAQPTTADTPDVPNLPLLHHASRVGRRARTAVFLLWIAAGVHAAMFALVASAEIADKTGSAAFLPESYASVATALQWAAIVSYFVTGIAYVMWLAGAYRAVPVVARATTRYASSYAVWGFFVPLVNCVLPYLVHRDLVAKVEPTRFPEPPPQPHADAAAGYRDRSTMPSSPRVLRRPPVGIWWALWLLGAVAGGATVGVAETEAAVSTLLVAKGIEVAAAIAAIVVVKRTTARMRECARRVAALPSPPARSTA